jgi:hypothetical protein
MAGVRVKMCGKSAHLRAVMQAGDKPYGLKCHVYPESCKGCKLLVYSAAAGQEG